MYSKAECWWWASLAFVVLGIVGAIVGLSDLLRLHSAGAAFVTLLSFSMPVLASVSRYWSATFAGKGDLCRRLLLYHDALDRPIPVTVSRDVALWPRRPLSKSTTTPYFASRREPGPKRLIEDVTESAFFTGKFAGVITRWAAVFVGMFFMLPILLLIFFSDLKRNITTPESFTLGAIAIFTMGVLVAEILVLAFKYNTLSRDAMEVSRRGTELMEAGVSTPDEALTLAENYSVALARDLPVLSLVYKLYNVRIEKAYKEALGK